MASTHTHPNPLTDRISQVGGAVLLVVMVAAALGQFVLAASVGLPLFWLSGVVTILLIAPVMMLSTATPTIATHRCGDFTSLDASLQPGRLPAPMI